MEIKRVYEILNNKEKVDLFYNRRPVWIQELKSSDSVKIGYVDESKESVVNIKEIYEK